MGPVERLVLEAWGVGIRVDTNDPQPAKLVDLIYRAREIDADEGRCGFKRYDMAHPGPAPRCKLPRYHDGEHEAEDFQ